MEKKQLLQEHLNFNTPLIQMSKVLVLRDVPMCVMLKEPSGKIEPFYLAYNVYCINNSKYVIYFSKSMKFRKEIYYQILHQVIIDVYSRKKYIDGGDSMFLSEVSQTIKSYEYKLFKLVPLSLTRDPSYCINSRVMRATIGAFNYYACNFLVCPKNPKRRTGFMIWREEV